MRAWETTQHAVACLAQLNTSRDAAAKQDPNRIRTKTTEHLGERRGSSIKASQDITYGCVTPPAFGDPQLVKILIREMLRLQCVQIQQNSSHTETKMTEYLGERKLNEGVCSLAFGDPQLVEVIIREMLKIAAHTYPGNAEAQQRLLAQRAPQVSLWAGGGDADERETNHGSSRGTLQAGLENEFRAKTLSQKDTAAHDCDPVFIEGTGT